MYRCKQKRIIMVKKVSVIFLVCCIFLASGWVSCTKEKEPETPFTRMVGKWKKVRYATDDNGNGVLDDYEMRPVTQDIVNILEFKKDSTGVEYATHSLDLPFSWYIGNEVSLMTIYKTGDSIAYKVVYVSGANLHLTTKSNVGLAGYYYDITK